MLELSPDLALPDGYVTSTGAVLAVRGAGKSNTGAVIAEEMYRQQLPFVVVDPVSAWWGLRSSKDGRGEGLPIPIFGGAHGDMPLEPGAGELLADLVVDERLSCILDLKQFDAEAAKRRFLLAFAQRLLKRNADPLHLFLEEADDYLPQRPGRDQLPVLGAFENIVRRGRSSGLGMTMITQRSAVLNKNVLTQTETLIAMRNTAPQDIAAVEAWVKYHAVGTELLASLAGLEDGEAWVWSPHFLKLKAPKRVQIRRRATYDSGATPKNVKSGSKRKVATLSDIDLGAIQARMAATIEKVNAENPALLRAQIATLRAAEGTNKRAYDELRHEYEAARTTAHRKAEVPRGDIRRVEQLVTRLDKALGQVQTVVSLLTPAIASLRVQTSAPAAPVSIRQAVPRIHPADRLTPADSLDFDGFVGRGQRAQAAVDAVGLANRGGPRSASALALEKAGKGRGGPLPPSADNGQLSGPAQKLLNALAWLQLMVRIPDPERRQVALVAERGAASSAFERELAKLKADGYIDYPSPNRLRLTDQGQTVAQVPARAPSLQELHASMYARLPRGQAALLKVLIEGYPDTYTRARAGGHADPPQSATSSAFERNCSALKALGLVEYPTQGNLKAAPVLFLEA